MVINPAQSAKVQQQYAAVKQNQKTKAAEEVAEKKQSDKKVVDNLNQAVADSPKDIVDSSKANYKIDTEKIAEMKAQFSQNSSSFRAMVAKMFEDQGMTVEQVNSTPLKDLFSKVVVDAETQKKAAEAISENGYYGVKKTSQRILEFAKALAGDDPSKIEALKSAFERGFSEAEKRWGGALPEISQKTRDAVMKGFEEWEKSLKSDDKKVVNPKTNAEIPQVDVKEAGQGEPAKNKTVEPVETPVVEPKETEATEPKEVKPQTENTENKETEPKEVKPQVEPKEKKTK